MLRGMCNRLVIGCYHCEHCALFWASVEGRMWVGEHLCLRDWIFIVQSGFSIVMFGMSVFVHICARDSVWGVHCGLSCCCSE